MKVLLDTKWKRLFPDRWNFGIAQADMYQAYAYGKEYDIPQTLFVYPRWGSLNAAPADYFHGHSRAGEQSFRIGIRTLDLALPLGSLLARLRLFKN